MPATPSLACGEETPPGERVLRPWLVSSLFPQLPKASRGRFRLALILLLVALAGYSLLQWPVPMLGTAMAGLPVLFLVYLREVHARNSVPARYLALATVLGLALGVGWSLITGPTISDAYNDAVVTQIDLSRKLLAWLVIPLSEALLLIAPAVVVRAIDRRPTVGSLDGFTIGALGALVTNGASTATLLAPQLAMGVAGDTQPVDGLLVEALVEGLAWPVASLATGGVIGIVLWFKRSANVPPRFRKVASIAVALTLVNMTAMCAIDIAPLSLTLYLGLQVLIALLAVVALRAAIAYTRRHGRSEETDTDSTTKSGYLRVLTPTVAGVGITIAIGMVAATLMTPKTESYVCPPDCGKPPIGNPVETNPRFSGDDGAFSVSYPGEGSVYEATFDPPGINGVQLKYLGGDTGTLTLFGEPAEERTPAQIAQQLMSTKYPGAVVDYEIPNASVGYQPGYGVVADVYPRDTSSGYTRLRVIIMVAIRHDYALIAMAAGPYHKFTPSYGTGHPSGANLEVAMDMGKYVNSFRWNGDRYEHP